MDGRWEPWKRLEMVMPGGAPPAARRSIPRRAVDCWCAPPRLYTSLGGSAAECYEDDRPRATGFAP